MTRPCAQCGNPLVQRPKEANTVFARRAAHWTAVISMSEPTDLTTIIADTISECVVKVAGVHWPIPDDQARLLASAVAAAIRETRTVRSVEELDALPSHAVVRWHWVDGTHAVGTRLDDGRWSAWSAGQIRTWMSDPTVVCRVLFLPDEDGE